MRTEGEELGAPLRRREKVGRRGENSFDVGSIAHVVRICSLHDALHAHFLAPGTNVRQLSDVWEGDLYSTESCGVNTG